MKAPTNTWESSFSIHRTTFRSIMHAFDSHPCAEPTSSRNEACEVTTGPWSSGGVEGSEGARGDIRQRCCLRPWGCEQPTGEAAAKGWSSSLGLPWKCRQRSRPRRLRWSNSKAREAASKMCYGRRLQYMGPYRSARKLFVYAHTNQVAEAAVPTPEKVFVLPSLCRH